MALLWLAFFLSGMAGLSYELTWVRYLTQMFGASTPAVSATVAIFFSGLAIGAALGGRWLDRTRHPMLAYARLETAIGVVATLVPLLFWGVEHLLAHYLHSGAANPLVLLLISALVLLGPTTLLGATFPAMAAVVRRIANPTYSTGFFYGFNTLGAVAGCLAVSFWLLPNWGPRLTTWGMASVNFSIALIFWTAHQLQRRRLSRASATRESRPAADDENVPGERLLPESTHVAPVLTESAAAEAEATSLSPRMAGLLAFTSGFLAIGIEVLWTRSLALSFPASVYVFALVLAAYLVGIGLGSVWVGAAYKQRRPHRRRLWLFYIAIGLGTLLTLWLFARLMPWSSFLLKNQWVTSWNGYLAWVGGSAVVAMLPATLAMGAAFPLLIGLATSRQTESSRVAGRLYAFNTIGGVLGSLFVTFTLMPWLGLSVSLLLLSAGYLALALWIAWSRVLASWLRWVTVGCLAFLGLLLANGGYPSANPLKALPGHTNLFYQDAPSATIAVDEDRQGVRTLRVNNFNGLSSTNPTTVAMQYRLGHIPMLLHPQPKRTLLVGFATGTTLAAMAQHKTSRVDCVELHKDLLEVAHYFSRVNHGVYKRSSQVRLIPEDGRRYLVRAGPSYDVIVGDLYQPRNPGVGVLYSLEHFRSVRERLKPNGLFVAWLPLFQLSPQNVASIVHSFLRVFPQAEGWVAHWTPSRAILGLIGRRAATPMKVPVDLEARLKAWVASSLQAMKGGQPGPLPALSPARRVANTSGALLRRLLSPAMLSQWASTAPINRLEQPVIEFSAPRAMMRARLHRFPLYLQNIRQIAELRSLQSTPWGDMAPALLQRKKPPRP